MNKPVKGKLTCKGKVPEQLSAVGVDHKKLHNTTIGGIDTDVSELMEQVADAVIAEVVEQTNKSGVDFGELLDRVNGAGYMDNWKAQIIRLATEAVHGTAAQGWAFKHTVAEAGGFDVDLFNSQISDKASVEVESEFD